MKHTQDVTSQAMTEVALALSMAFFSLLILVLVTMKLPDITHNVQNNQPFINKQTQHTEVNVELAQHHNNKFTSSAPHQLKNSGASHPNSIEGKQFAFYYGTVLYDQHLQPFNKINIDNNKPLIIAVGTHSTLNEIIQLKKQINHPNASITSLSQEWLNALEQLQ